MCERVLQVTEKVIFTSIEKSLRIGIHTNSITYKFARNYKLTDGGDVQKNI